ncbi:MAG: hypothetical protein IT359_12910 [Gemmatimonadaceae bacterium]|nr:hypothetical protein [Gemmatimonadaceae bacterium]
MHSRQMQRARRAGVSLAMSLAASIAVALLAMSAPALAQQPTRATRWLYAAELGVLHSNHPYDDGIPAYGLSFGVERGWTERLAVRTVLAWAESLDAGDDVSICHPTSTGACYPAALFPLRTWTLELDGVYTPDGSVPLKLVAGGGLAYPIGIRQKTSVSDHQEHDRTLKGLARVGASLGLGTSVRAPRLQYTRGWLSGAYESFDRIDQLSFVVVF